MELPTFVISLPDARVRRANMTERLGALGIGFRFVDAIDGRTERPPDKFDGARIVRTGFSSEAAIGCALSHRAVHRMIADSADEWSLVLEDDVAMAPDFREAVSCAMALRCDVVKLEGSSRAVRRLRVGRLGERSIMVGLLPSINSAAYLIRREAAVRFCALTDIDQPIDLAFGDPRLKFRVFDLEPFPAFQDRHTPSEIALQPRAQPRHLQSWRKKAFVSSLRRLRIARVYGIGVALRFELQRLHLLRP